MHRQILFRLAKGEKRSSVADALRITPRTVRAHIERARDRLGFHTTIEVVIFFARTHDGKRSAKAGN